MKIKIKSTENEVKKAIREYLEFNGWTVYRINNAGIFRGYNKAGEKRFSFDGDIGVCDLYVVKDGECPLWIETKATGKKPTKGQQAFMKAVNSTINGRAFWVDSLDMFIKIFYGIKNGYGLLQ